MKKEVLLYNLFYKPDAKRKFYDWLRYIEPTDYLCNLVMSNCTYISNSPKTCFEISDLFVYFQESSCRRIVFCIFKTKTGYSVLFNYLSIRLFSTNLEFFVIEKDTLVDLMHAYDIQYKLIKGRYEYRFNDSILLTDLVSILLIPLLSPDDILTYLVSRHHKVWVLHTLARNWIWKPVCHDGKAGIAVSTVWKTIQNNFTAKK